MRPARGWPALAGAGLAGAVAAFGQSPYDFPLLTLLGLSGAVWLFQARATPWQAALTGWAFGTGYFAHSLQWIVSPFFVDAARHGWMAPFALVLMAAGLALFWGLAFWLARIIAPSRLWPLALTWAAVEMLRAYIFTGFPWAMPSQALVGQASGQLLAWIGPYGLNLLMFAAALLIGGAQMSNLRRGMVEAGCGALAALALLLPYTGAASAMGQGVIRLIQPNAPQHEKWDPEKIPIFFDRQLRLTATPLPEGSKSPDLVLWPETAIPYLLEHAAGPLAEISQAAGDAQVGLGLQRRDPAGYYNAMITLGPNGAVNQIYDKHHLVPFGEYMPFTRFFSRIEIGGLAARVTSAYAAGPGPSLLNFGDLGTALPLICYEAVFPHDVNAAPQRPDFLIQITNDAWFGKGAGPRQHLAQARMRAIEQGLPLARAANTGISAMIDPKGRVLAALPLNEAGFLDAALPLPQPLTLYSRSGDLPLALLLLIGLASCAFLTRRRS
ncbi:MAG: apolipoprotein N-acyltransferase [Pseudomonadota bacterium]